MSLGQVLLAVALMVTVAFAVVELGFSHLAVSTRTSNAARARSAAESTLALALDRLAQDAAWGTQAGADRTLRYADSLGAASGMLSFDSREARRAHLPWSTNNLVGTAAVASSTSLQVPPHAAHLVAVGTCNGLRQSVEAEVNLPDLPYVLASSGPVLSQRGGLYVACLKSLDALAQGLSGLPADQLTPGHLASNSKNTSTRQAVLLGPGSRVTGDVRTPGDVRLDPSARVLGAVRHAFQGVGLPKLTVADFDTAGRPDLNELSSPLRPAAGTSAIVLTGPCRASMGGAGLALEVQGDLTLQDALLYVEGDLLVHGGISGRGAVVVRGRTTVERGVRLQAGGAAALLSQGDVVLLGDSKDASAFVGLVYTEGNFTAERISLLGTFVANGGGEGSLTQVNDVALVGLPGSSRVTVGLGTSSSLTARVAINDNPGENLTVSYQGTAADLYNASTQSYDPSLVAMQNVRINGTLVSTWWTTHSGLYKRGQGGTANNFNGFLKSVSSALAAAATQQASKNDSSSSGDTRIDLNEYVRLSDRLRVLIWRDLPLE